MSFLRWFLSLVRVWTSPTPKLERAARVQAAEAYAEANPLPYQEAVRVLQLAKTRVRFGLVGDLPEEGKRKLRNARKRERQAAR